MDPTELLAPISAAAPAGVSLRGEYIYRQIELARMEEDDVPQGAWTRARKTADPGQVVALATDVLLRQSKDLQVAAWLTEAWTMRDGLAGLVAGLQLVHALMDRYWDDLHPALEFDDPELGDGDSTLRDGDPAQMDADPVDGDPDGEKGDPVMRAAALEWMDQVLPAAVRAVPLTRAGHGMRAYEESRALGYESAVKEDADRHRAWLKDVVENGRVSADSFDRGLAQTRADSLVERRTEAATARTELESLRRLCALRFADDPPRFLALRGTLEGIEQLAGLLLELKPPSAGPAPVSTPAVETAVVSEASSSASASSTEPASSAEPPSDVASAVPPSGNGADAQAAMPASALPSRPTADVSPPAAAGAIAIVPADAPRSRDEAAARVAALARWLRAEDPADPAPYLMVRGFRWGELRAGADVPDPRLLAAPPTAVRVHLRTLALDGRWAELLEGAEEVMASEHGRGWLDLQRYVATACAELGPAYDAVREAIAGALRTLLRDIPALPGLMLMDDTPAANRETLAWLRESGLTAVDGDGNEDVDGPSPPPRGSSPEDRARAQAAAGQAGRAVEILLDAADRERSARARFLLRTRAAEVMVDAGLEAVAVPILREMVEQVQRHTLEAWETGEVVARPLALLCRCLDRVGGAPGEREPLYLRVCRLDPVRAIQLGGGADAAA